MLISIPPSGRSTMPEKSSKREKMLRPMSWMPDSGPKETFAAREFELLGDVGSGYFVKRHGTGQCGYEQQEVEQGGEEDGQQGAFAKGLLKNVGQGNEGEAGSCTHFVGIHADVEHGGEDDEACHDGDECVDDGHVGSCLCQWCLLVEIAGVCAEAAHAQAEGEEGLSHGGEDNAAIYLRPVGL